MNKPLTVTFIVRSPGTGHSLETLFSNITDELNRAGTVQPVRYVLPFISRGLPTVRRNLRAIRTRQPGFVHVTGDVHYAALATDARRTVLTIPDCVLLSRTPKWSLRYALFWLLWYYLPIRRAAVVTAISEKTKRELAQYVGRLADKVVVVPCHYDPAFTYRPKPFNPACPTLLHIGTAPHKNLSRLIDALAGLPCRLIIVGKLTAAERTHLTAQRIRYESCVDISRDEIRALYDQCDIVTFVSLYEGFGLPVLEAQVVGRPVVTSNRSPMTDVGGAGACYVDPTDVADIRRGILRVWADGAYRDALVRAGRANAGQYTLARVAAQYAALYHTLAG